MLTICCLFTEEEQRSGRAALKRICFLEYNVRDPAVQGLETPEQKRETSLALMGTVHN